MLRELCLVLDGEGKSKIYKGNAFIVLREDEAVALDKYTTSFESSDDIRKEYKAQIDSFLLANEKYCEAYKKRTNRTNNGCIVILENLQINGTELVTIIKKVLYKKHVRQDVILNMLKNENVLNVFLSLDGNPIDSIQIKSVIPPSITKAIDDYKKVTLPKDKPAGVKRIYRLFVHEKLNKEDRNASYFERVRLLVKAYKIVSEKDKLPKIEQLYKEVLRLSLEKKEQATLQSGKIQFYLNDTTILNAASLALMKIKHIEVNQNGQNVAYDRDAWYKNDYLIPDEYIELTSDDDEPGYQR